jgi:hypothetical protein
MPLTGALARGIKCPCSKSKAAMGFDAICNLLTVIRNLYNARWNKPFARLIGALCAQRVAVVQNEANCRRMVNKTRKPRLMPGPSRQRPESTLT